MPGSLDGRPWNLFRKCIGVPLGIRIGQQMVRVLFAMLGGPDAASPRLN